MNGLVTGDINLLFKKYETSFREFNFKEQAMLFGDHIIAAGPGAIVYHRNNFLSRFFYSRGMKSYYKKTGMNSIKIISIHETPVSSDFSLVKVNWGATFNQTGPRVIEYIVSYIVRKTRTGPEIIMFISHADEQQELKKLGIIT